MTTSSRLLVPASRHPNVAQERAQALGFSVNLDSGRGLLTTRHRRLGPLVVDTLSLEIPHLAFPFDVSGGAARFKKRRCALVHLAMHVDAADLLACLSEHDVRAHGFTRLHASVFDGFILLAGHFTHGEHAADFTCRIAPVVQGGREVHFVFYDTRVYGFLPVPGAHLTRYLWRSLRWPDWFTERPAAWQLRPIDAFARELLPRGGWKIPAMQQLQDLSVAAQQGQLHVACGEANQPGMSGPDMPTEALQATDGIALNGAAEDAVHDGNLTLAYELLRRAVDDGQGSGWAALRLMHIGAALPQFSVDLRHYAQQFLERGVHPTHARLTLASLAIHSGNQAVAAAHLAALGHDAQQRQHCQDAAAAWLAQSRVQVDIDLDGALQAGHAAVGLAPQQAAAHAHMFRLHRKKGDLEQAAQAAERWAQYCDRSPETAHVFCDLGAFFREQVQDLVKARRMYEHALSRVPEFPQALAGLAELHLHKGDTTQAVTFFTRLATHWEAAGDIAQAVGCHWRLADIWQHRLGDKAASTARYKKVMELDPTCLPAAIALADLAYAADASEQALTLYQVVIAADTSSIERAPEQAVRAYEQAIAILQQTGQDTQQAALQLAYLDRLVQLRPDHAEACAMRMAFLRAQKIHDRLAQLLTEQAHTTEDPTAACSLLLEAARLAGDDLQDRAFLQRILEAACQRLPAHQPALDLLVPLLQEIGDWQKLHAVLGAAYDASGDAGAKVRYLVGMAQAQGELGQPNVERVATLHRALELRPNDPLAAQAMVDTLEADPASEQATVATAYEILAQALRDPADRAQAWMASARRRQSGLAAIEAARRAVTLVPQRASAHRVLVEVLDASGHAQQVQQAFAAAASQVQDEADLVDLWTHQAHWAQNAQAAALQLQALQGLAGMDRLTGEQALALVTALQTTGQTDRAVAWLEQWADAGAPLDPSEALLLAASMWQSAQAHSRAQALLERVLRHPPQYAQRAAQALEDLAQATHNEAWLAQAWRAQIASAADASSRVVKQARLLLWQTENRHPERLDTARALLQSQPSHPLACQVLASHHDSEKAWGAGLDARMAMLSAPADPVDAERRRAAYLQAASVAVELRPDLMKTIEAGFSGEFPGATLSYEPLGEHLEAQHRWDDLLALRREQQRRAPKALAWQRAIATLLEAHFDKPDEAHEMWRAICATDPTHVESLQKWQQSAERADDVPAQAAAHAAQARHGEDPEKAWQHALQSARLHAEPLGAPAEARKILQDCLGALPPPQDVTALVERCMALRMFAAVLGLAPENWLDIKNTPAWTERIEQALQGQGKHFEHIAFVLHQVPLGTYDKAHATALLIRLMVHCPTAATAPQQDLMADAHAFCAQSLRASDPDLALEHCRQALQHHLAPHALGDLHESLLLATRRFSEAAELHLAEARCAGQGAGARRHFEALADLCEKHLQDPARARWAIEQAVQQAPRDVALLRRLLNMIPLPEDRSAFVATAEALIAVSADAQQDVALLQKLAHICADIDRPRAVALLRQAMTLVPSDALVREQWRALSEGSSAASAGSAASAAPVPPTPDASPTEVQVAAQAAKARAASKADPVLQNIAAWHAAVTREPRNLGYRERYAAACAQSQAHLPAARMAYLDLLQRDCTHTPWLRVLARLEGAMQDSVAAYAFYAALLAVQPADAEAQRFVHACRQLRPGLPSRPFGASDWHMIRSAVAPHPQPARAQALAGQAIEPRALSALAPEDPKIAPLVAFASYLGLPMPHLCLWPAGGRQCAMARAAEPTLMLGAALYNDLPNRAGLFLGLRTLLQAQGPNMQRAHGNGAALALAADVAEATDALCMAEGMVLPPHASRAALIKKTPELLDLLRFAQSPTYLKLRHAL